jgi:SAM-dependent methyltransferase
MTENFKDYFSQQAAQYAAYRPTYPMALFQYVAGVVAQHNLAWDCATGSGQAAIGIAPYFARVIATDASVAQIAHAIPHPRVEYRVAPAEQSGIEPDSVDLVTVATALHWFNLDAFYAEVNRVLTADGVIAVWGYGDPVLDTPALHAAVDTFNFVTLSEYWPPERHLLTNDGYRSLPFPFKEIETPSWMMEEQWTLYELLGYFRTWSAVQRYIDKEHRDPVEELARELSKHWGDPEHRHRIQWPVRMRAGYKR